MGRHTEGLKKWEGEIRRGRRAALPCSAWPWLGPCRQDPCAFQLLPHLYYQFIVHLSFERGCCVSQPLLPLLQTTPNTSHEVCNCPALCISLLPCSFSFLIFFSMLCAYDRWDKRSQNKAESALQSSGIRLPTFGVDFCQTE